MLQLDNVDQHYRASVRRFIDVPFRIYRDDFRWVPPLRRDVALALDPRRHPFYEHSEAAFFLAMRDGRDVGRIAALEHKPYNRWHDVRKASFAYFECDGHDNEAAAALFERVFVWARARGLDRVVGPRGLGALDGYGLLVDGFERRQLMTMTAYNTPWYRAVIERLGL